MCMSVGRCVLLKSGAHMCCMICICMYDKYGICKCAFGERGAGKGKGEEGGGGGGGGILRKGKGFNIESVNRWEMV